VLVELWASPDLDLPSLNELQWESARYADLKNLRQLATNADTATRAPKRVAALGTLIKVVDRSYSIGPTDTLFNLNGLLPRSTDHTSPAPAASVAVARTLLTALARDASDDYVRLLSGKFLRAKARPTK